jgi:2-polyprenyl-3-methyl-5-hydroxy-6-metoxy-1,4-benzoquinol methylase
MKNSTSIHNINADKTLTKVQKLFYVICNIINNNQFYAPIDNKLIISNFVADISDEDWNQLHIKSSPSRKLTDLFWLKLQWESIKLELGEIHVLDIGCGSGNCSVKLQIHSDNSIASYTGIDINKHNNWDKLSKKNEKAKFYKSDCLDVLDYVSEDTNFIISQSSLEHVEEDLLFFEKISSFIQQKSRKVMQIHFIPASASLKLYLTHGVRQYSPQTVSKVTRNFNEFSQAVLLGLGGKNCNTVHWQFITKPQLISKVDRRDSETEEYDRKLRQAITLDMKKPQKKPHFYALIIYSNWSDNVFREHYNYQ